ncbi:MAG: cytochrome c, partial [Acidobacteria bacterium]|nr:cytochrome c [Acidobacteriota bacterium]
MLDWLRTARLRNRAWPRMAGAALAAWLGSAPGPAAAPGPAPLEAGAGAQSRPAPGAATFARDVAPLLLTHCAACHQPGGIAPFSVLTHHDVRPWARAIRQSVRTRSMPPWKPRPGHGGPFVAERRLSDAEIDLIAAWVDAGAPEGGRTELPPGRRGRGEGRGPGAPEPPPLAPGRPHRRQLRPIALRRAGVPPGRDEVDLGVAQPPLGHERA